MIRVLIVEDDPQLGYGLSMNFEFEGWSVVHADNGIKGLDALRQQRFHVVVLDVLLPDMSGLDLLRTARREGYDVPVLILSACTEEVDRITGFRLGADDYVCKPFSLLELIERIKSLANPRYPAVEEPRDGVQIQAGFAISRSRREVTYNGRPIHLKPREFDLLTYLIQAGGAVVSKQQILEDVWGIEQRIHTRTVDSTFYALRIALQAAGLPKDAFRTVARRGLAWNGDGSADCLT